MPEKVFVLVEYHQYSPDETLFDVISVHTTEEGAGEAMRREMKDGEKGNRYKILQRRIEK